MRILITGGTGSLGQALTEYFSSNPYSTVIVFSRDEWKQAQMARRYHGANIRYFLGDVRDRDRLRYAFRGVDIVIHAAALKRVDALAYNPTEVIQTNILGTQHVLDMAIDCRVRRVLVVSSDKACEPTNIYGKTKAAAEELAVSYNSLSIPQQTGISVVRYGNVLTSRGSAYHLFKECAQDHRPIPLTDMEMTRFAISMPQAVKFIVKVIGRMEGGEIFIPRLPSIRIVDLARAVAPHSTFTVVGLRPGGEKLHECMISRTEVDRLGEVVDMGCYVLSPPVSVRARRSTWARTVSMNKEWSYTSKENTEWLKVDQIRTLIETGTCPGHERGWE